MNLSRPRTVLAAAVLAAAFPAVGLQAGAAAPPEPADYRQDHYKSPLPLTLQGAEVLDTQGLARRRADPRTIVVDVLPQEPRPPRLAPGNVWMPPPHEGIAGAVWLPNVGYGRLPKPLQDYFADGLRRITAGDRDRPLAFYCRSDCWMSWNSAKRALSLGYRHVLWYRDGIEAWKAAGLPTAMLKPLGDPPPAP